MSMYSSNYEYIVIWTWSSALFETERNQTHKCMIKTYKNL